MAKIWEEMKEEERKELLKQFKYFREREELADKEYQEYYEKIK